MDSPEFVVIGRIAGAWGRSGDIKAEVLTDFPERFAPGNTIYIGGNPFTIASNSFRRGLVMVKLEGIDSVNEAEKLAGQTIEVPLSPLPPGQYYHFQLVGLDVVTNAGLPIGKITGILPGAGADVYIINGPDGEHLVPAVADIVKEIDLAARRVTIEPIEGLL